MATTSSSSSSIVQHSTALHTPMTEEAMSQSSFSTDDEGQERPTVQDPSAIVGMACRLPGANDTHELWTVLSQKKDLQRKIPEDRFNVDAFFHPQGSNKGTTNAKYGYFLDQGLDEFDAQFFNISGKEAEAMDPQQRILLEVVYEALENAGITLSDISGSQTSVYCGSFSNDYSSMTTKDLTEYPKYTVTGTGNAIISNRISYFYNLHGPSYTIDTACSSSLVCFHLANESIQRGECETAIVCGSALHFDPNIFITMTDFGMLSVDGRCRTFDAKGSGYVRGDGICAIVLRKQSFAETSGDRIRAVVLGTGSNHDGIKDGLTLPNEMSQARLLRQTYKKAGLDPINTDYFEAHGTGTSAGDPREIAAITSVFAPNRVRPLVVGSIKSNLGHTEGASGTAGIIKTVLSIESGVILPNMHFEEPNPNIDFKSAKIEVPTKTMDWIGRDGVRRASINSFGYGGSNAHAIIQNYTPRGRQQITDLLDPDMVGKRPYLLPLTAHSENAGKIWISKLEKYLDGKHEISATDLAYSLSSRRSMHRYRSFAIGHDQISIIKSLKNPGPTQTWTQKLEQKPRLGFIFTGQGAQWFAMGKQLIQEDPSFRKVLERCDEILQTLPDSPDWSCVIELLKPEEESQLSRSAYSQPICAALQLALVEVLTNWGITPSAVVGHSSGEIVAAYAAGILSFESTIICAYYRGLYMSKGLSTKKGAMMAVGLTEDEGKIELEPYNGRIALAAVNSPSSLTISGDEDAILELKSTLESRKIFARQLQVEQAFHSHHMIPLAPAFKNALDSTLSFKAGKAKIPMFSSVTARDSNATSMDAAYWAANMTGQVRFSDALTGILLDDDDEARVDVLVEIGAHPALKGPSKQVMKSLNIDIPYLASLTRNDPAFDSLLATAGQLHSLGYPVDLVAVNSVYRTGDLLQSTFARRLVDLPSYPWDHSKYWAETRLIREHRLRTHRHTILGAPVAGAPGNHPRWRNYLRLNEIPWLSQHVVDGKILFPAAGYVSMAIEAIATLVPTFKTLQFRDVVFQSALVISGSEKGTEVMLELDPHIISAKSTSSSCYHFRICSFDDNYRTIENCHGLIAVERGAEGFIDALDADETYAELRQSTTRSRKCKEYYKQLAQSLLQYGEDFQLLSGEIESGDGLSLSNLSYKPSNVVTTPADACILHPTLLDASFHVVFAAIESKLGRALDDAYVPTFIRSMSVSGLLNSTKYDSTDKNFWIRCKTILPGSRIAINDISIQAKHTDDVLVSLHGLELTALGNETADEAHKRSLFLRIAWQPLFSHLGKTKHDLSFDNISDVMDIYCHQFPNARILHVSPGFEASKELLLRLGGYNSVRRRFQSISIISQSSDVTSIQDSLAVHYKDLVDTIEPIESSFDVIVVSEQSEVNAIFFLKENGYLIYDGILAEDTGLLKVFQCGKFTIYQKSKATTACPEQTEAITMVLPVLPSPKTLKFVSEIQSLHKGNTSQVTMAALLSSESRDINRNVIILASLDENIFFESEQTESINFHAIQRLLSGTKRNIVWLLRGASHETSCPEQAIILGLARSARSENEFMRLATLDVPLDYEVSGSARHALELLNPDFREDELAERNGLLLVPRLIHDDELNKKLPNGGHRQSRLEPFRQDRRLALKIGKVGLLDSLCFEDDEDVLAGLGDDDVEIEVKASALNFRDIAASVGIIDDYRLGDECAGIVVRTGRNVPAADFESGDRVVAWRPGQGSHRSVVRNPAVYTQKIGNMDFVTAASVLCVATTAHYALFDVARLQPGEYCLIHAAAGGVGQMAVQIAQMIGAKVIVTCGASAKRDYLKQKFGLSDDVIFSSRDSSFVEGVLRLTNGRGCDVALNSLAGELLHATWACIARFGRMIEIGKRDIHENTKLDMDPFRKNVSYASVDLITIFNYNRSLGNRLVRECFRLVRDGKIKHPGPIVEVPYSDAQKGFRMLQMGKFFGKVVLVPDENSLVPVMPPLYRNTILFNPDKTYLLVGGLGGLGRSLSQWMFRKGARKLAFLSRSGAKTSDAQASVEWLKIRGAQVTIFTADVTSQEGVNKCIHSIGPKLGGIFQAAMVLKDIPLTQMSIDQWRACVYPKIRGAYNLHLATLNQDLDFFVCFSSCSAIIGAMAQANYAAANTYLDALMRHRRENGLTGFTMNVGRVGGIGVVAESDNLEKIMDRLGYEAISEEELFYQIEEAISRSSCSREDVDVTDWHQLITGISSERKDLYWASKPLFRNFYANLDLLTQENKRGSAKSLSISLRSTANFEDRTNILRQAFLEKIAAVLVVPVTTVQAENSLSVYGLDSIVAVEFRKWFSKTVGVELAVFDILGAKSIEALTRQVSNMIEGSSQSTDVSLPGAKSDEHIDIYDHYSSSKTTTGSVIKELTLISRPHNIPLSTFQNRMWFLHNMLEDPSSLNFAVTCYLHGEPRADILSMALTELIRRNDILRTGYSEGENYAEQTVSNDFCVPLTSVDFSTYQDSNTALKSYTEELRSSILDIEKGKVMRISLVKMHESEYVLIFVVHHIALDNGSTKSSMDQLTQLYDSFAQGHDSETVLSPKLTYTDFTLWHNNKLEASELSVTLDWWKETFANAPAVSQLLPFAQRERSEKASRNRFVLRDTLGLAFLKRMKRVCARATVTPFQLVLAAFRAFLYRYTQEDDLTILMADGNRPSTEFDEILGFFVNTIPLRLRDSCEQAFDHFLTSVKQTTLDALAHSQVPFDAIIDGVKARSHSGHSPLGQIAINYQMYGKAPKYKTSHFEIYDVINEDIPTACDLALEITEDPATGLLLRLEYDTDLYGFSDMERFFENFTVFLKDIIMDFRQPIDEIKMCGPKEISYLKTNCWEADVTPNEWNNQSIWDRVSVVAATQPESIAIKTSDGEVITYAGLLLQTRRIAQALRVAGAKPTQLIGILSAPGVEMIATMMATISLRCGYVPLDPDFAPGRLAHMIDDSSISFLVFDDKNGALSSSLRQISSPVMVPLSSVTFERLEDFPLTVAEPNDPLYVIYTSGSTGKPKGVVISHENTQAMLSSHNKLHNFGPHDTILFHSSMSFDLSVAQIWGSLTSGSTMALASLATRKDPESLARFMYDVDITVTYIPATQFSLLLEHNSADLRKCSKFRLALFAGEYLPARTVQAIYDLQTPVTVINQWGPTETTVQTSSHKTALPSSDSFNIPIGKPIHNCSHYVVDRKLNPLPATVVGELCIGGSQVSLGYLNSPEKNDQAFVLDPFASDSFLAQGWNRLYRTGDKGHFLPNGEMQFKGRISGDKQIKLRGYRIDIAEIEHELYVALKIHGLYKAFEVVVLLRKKTLNSITDGGQLIAFIASEDKQCKTKDKQVELVTDLHRKLGESLNDYMRPSGYQFLETLPKLISGKVDTQSLLCRDLELVYPGATRPEDAEVLEAEKQAQDHLKDIAKLFSAVLSLEADRTINKTDSFFDLGGQSVLLLRLQSRIQRRFNVKIPLPSLFQNATPAGIAALLMKQSTSNDLRASGNSSLAIAIDWKSESTLPTNDSFYPARSLSRLARSGLQYILLTGVDSYVGVHTLQKLLLASPATIHVIGTQARADLLSINASFSKYELFTATVTESSLKERIRLVPGTLALPHFGLDHASFTALGQQTQAIFHLGAQVSLLKSYSDLKQVNVTSTRDLIELASLGSSLTELHYLSTWSVVHLQAWNTTKRTRSMIDKTETAPTHFQPESENRLGYFKSRWVAEALLVEAARRGFPISIYRSSAITSPLASSVATPENNFTHNMVLDMIERGQFPETDTSIASAVDFVPVDYLAATLVGIAASEATKESEKLAYYHVGNTSPISWRSLPEFVAKVRKESRPAVIVPLAEWIENMRSAAHTETAKIEWSVFKEYLDLGHTMFSLENKKTQEALHKLGEVAPRCPPLDEKYLKHMLQTRKS